jgi:hypothetical protein
MALDSGGNWGWNLGRMFDLACTHCVCWDDSCVYDV